ncbi:apolipoprotein L6 isoform X2 [Ursus arctos]|uniref:apolipoprotein L6 isoform X2 n=1 Tax=Ursus arctos TaxID=9644 RepID=UPI002016E1C1|nr:apolipoprotein L6 isoform X2 [Ursus arctos]
MCNPGGLPGSSGKEERAPVCSSGPHLMRDLGAKNSKLDGRVLHKIHQRHRFQGHSSTAVKPTPRFSAGSEEASRASGFPPGSRPCWRLCASRRFSHSPRWTRGPGETPCPSDTEKSRGVLLNFTATDTPQNCQGVQAERCVTHEDISNSPMGQKSSTLRQQEPLDNECPRDQDDILPCQGVWQQDKGLSVEEITFLREFPLIKRELEEDIRKLHALADDIDATHRTFAKTHMVATSMTVVSNTMTMLGLILAPATIGGSLMLSAAGKALGTVAGVTSTFTDVMEHFQNQEAQTQASSLVPAHDDEVEEAQGKIFHVVSVGKKAYDYGSSIGDVKRNINAFQIARANPQLTTAAKRLLTTGQVSARRTKQLQRAFKGTTVLIKKNARVLCSALAGFSLCHDVVTLLSDWKQLKEGARTKLAEELRAQAGVLEEKLMELTQLYESLQQL